LQLAGPHRRRLLDEDVQARSKGAAGQWVMRGHGRRDHDGVEVAGGDHLLEVACHPRVRVALRELGTPLLARVAEPAEVGELVEVAREVAAPVSQPRLADAKPLAHSLKTCSAALPLAPVALRRSTTSGASSTSLS